MAQYSIKTVAALAMLAAIGLIPALPASAAETSEPDNAAAAANLTDGAWTQENGRFYYVLKDGTRATGEVCIDGVPYLFGFSGALKTDWQTVDGKRYYYDPADGKAVFGFVTYFDKTYYVTPEDGKLTGDHSIGSEMYCFDEDGVLYAAMSPVEAEAPLHAGAPAAPAEQTAEPVTEEAAEPVTEPVTENMTEPAAEPVTEEVTEPVTEELTEAPTEPETTVPAEAESTAPVLTGFHTFEGKTYYYFADGTPAVGWLVLDNGKFYFDENSVMVTGWHEENGNRYYFQENGLMEESATLDIDGVECTFDENGVLISPLPVVEELPEQTGPAVQLDVPLFKQKDPAWGSASLGYSTIGSVGCLVTSMAMLHTYTTGQTCDPIQMRDMLAFSSGGGLASWSYVSDLGYTVESYDTYMTNALLEKIYGLLHEGKPVMIGCEGGGMHFVLITGYTGDGVNFRSADFIMNDPGYNSTTLDEQLNRHGIVFKLVY